VPTLAQPTPSCDFKSGKIILQQPVEREQMGKLLQTGKTDLLDKFVSNRTRRNFKAFLVWDGAAGKVNFEFEQRESKYPARKTAGAAAAKTTTAAAKKTARQPRRPPPDGDQGDDQDRCGEEAPHRERHAQAQRRPGRRDRQRTLAPRRDQKALGLHQGQRPAGCQDKRAINADAKLKPVFGKEQISMFELAGIVGKHVS
jgi:DNA topoisomerase-3